MIENIEQILVKGEGERVEFKSSFNAGVIESLVAFANTHGGAVYIGISDSGELKGIQLAVESVQSWINEIKSKTIPSIIPDYNIFKIDDKSVVSLSIKEFPIKPVSVRGKYFKRVVNSNHLMTTSEVVEFHLKSFNLSWDYHTDQTHSLDDISLEKVQFFLDKLGERDRIIKDSPLDYLWKLELIRNNQLTNACYLTFMKEESPFTTIELGRFQTDIIIKDSQRIKTDLFSEVNFVIDFIKKHINKEIIIKETAQSIEKWQYPMESIREIVMNMIVHRDYRSSSDSIVKIFNDRIEFYNPGNLPPGITILNLISDNYISTPRNKLIADLFKEAGMIEKYGTGIKRVFESIREAGLPAPEFKEIADGILVTIYSREANVDLEKTVEKTVEKILSLIKRNPCLTQKELADLTGLTQRGIEWNLRKMKNEGLIERVGPDKGGRWEIK